MSTEDKFFKIIIAYKIARMVNSAVAGLFAIWVAGELAHNLFSWVLVAGFITLAGAAALNALVLMGLCFILPTQQTQEIIDHIQSAQTVSSSPLFPVMTDTITIVDRPPQPLGFYQGTEFYEWILVQGQHGEVTRFEYDGTVPTSPDQDLARPKGWLLLPPGILYKPAVQA